MVVLLHENTFIPQKWMSKADKQKIETSKGIDYLISYIDSRIWTNKDTPPRIKLRGIGDKVLVLKSGTGTGKSALIAPALYNTFYDTQHKGIILTEPTRANAIDIPYQIIPFNPNLKIGDNIGFQTSTVSLKPSKGILICTVGILLQYLKMLDDEDFMKKYGFILIDEVHIRSMDLDMVLYYLKKLLVRNWAHHDCPFIILMSGTFEPSVFMQYFECKNEHYLEVKAVTSHPIKDVFSEFDISNYIEYVTDLCENLHVSNVNDILNSEKFRHVLVFVQGSSQIRQIINKLHKLNADVFSKGLQYSQEHNNEQQSTLVDKYKIKQNTSISGGLEDSTNTETNTRFYYILPISLMSENISKGGDEYMNLYSDIDVLTTQIYTFDEKGERTNDIIATVPVSRKIMVGTNAVETGLTIDGLKYCIDTGFVKDASFNPNFGCKVLVDKNVTKASSKQRRGRVGRNAPGEFYACYTAETHALMADMTFPDIVKEDISVFVLNVIIKETNAQIIPVNFTDKSQFTDVFQMNQIDQQWYRTVQDNYFNASLLDFIQYPSADSIGYSIEKLHILGFIDHEYNATLMGLYASKFRKMKLENIRMILAGYQYGANILDLITMACCIDVGFEIGIQKRKYVPRNPLQLDENLAHVYYKLIFADEFIEYLFIWNDFMQAIEAIGDTLERHSLKHKKKAIAFNYLPNWCVDNHFKLDGLMKVVELRDDVIHDMLTIGLNPYYNGLEVPRGTYNLVSILRRNLDEGMSEIKKLKQCIYEGYRLNVCTWTPDRKSYVSDYSNISIVLDSKIIKPLTDETVAQNRPKKIIVSDITLREGFGDLYEFMGGDISVLDGFVVTDDAFMYH